MVERYKTAALVKSNLPEKRKGGFQPGAPRPDGAGRTKGKPNKTTTFIKDAISGACEKLGELEPIWKYTGKGQYRRKDKIIGWKPTGKGGSMGYMIWLGCNYPTAFASLVGKMIPLQVNASGSVDLTIPQRFSDVQIEAMPLAEKMAVMREMIGLTKPLAAPEVAQTQPRMIEGESTRVKDNAST